MKTLLKDSCLFRRDQQRGAIIALVAVLIVVFLGMGALAIDLSHLYVVRNELQNAADAGALAGARVLYEKTAPYNVNVLANQEAYDAATANQAISEKGTKDVDVYLNSNELDSDVQRGHWSFGLGDLPKGFYHSNNIAFPNLWDKSTEELDEDPNFVNAIKVVTRRDENKSSAITGGTNAASFFAKIFGFDDFLLSADAVGYIGYAGSLKPNDVDLPVALCAESLLNEDGEYSCSFGRMLNSGSNPGDHNTGEWTNFKQNDQCSTADTGDMRDILTDCTTGNPQVVYYGEPIGGTGGVVDNLINHPSQPNITACWKQGTGTTTGMPAIPWTVTLPVISCPRNQPKSCDDSTVVVGSVTVNILWILENENKINDDAPYTMYNPMTGSTWSNSDPDGIVRWNSFVDAFGLQMPISDTEFGPAYYSSDPAVDSGFKKKSIYFMPDCTPHAPGGNTGGENFGTLAEIPVLVE